jgi:hypothetical protein
MTQATVYEPPKIDPGGKWLDVSVDEYHAHDAQGSSMLEDFRESRRLYFDRHVAKRSKREPTETMDLGTMIHIALLEPEKWDERVAEPLPEHAPDGKNWLRRKGSEHERAWREMLDARAGRIIPKNPGVVETVRLVVQAIHDNERSAKLLAQPAGQTEFAILWTDADTGIECKCLVDWFAPIAFDLKTTTDASPREWSRRLVSLGYHRKLAHYQAGLNSFSGDQHPFVHIAAETTPPYRIGNYELDDREPREQLFKLGVAQRRRTLRDLKACREAWAAGDERAWWEPWEKEVTRISLPGWAFTEDQWEGLT